jgi:hypothetical protein
VLQEVCLEIPCCEEEIRLEHSVAAQENEQKDEEVTNQEGEVEAALAAAASAAVEKGGAELPAAEMNGHLS